MGSADRVLQQSYSECDTFCVVRNPIDRAISAHTYLRREAGLKNLACSAIGLGSSLKMPYALGCFFVPQAEFVFGANGSRLCQHVLHFENLTAEFNLLMQRYG